MGLASGGDATSAPGGADFDQRGCRLGIGRFLSKIFRLRADEGFKALLVALESGLGDSREAQSSSFIRKRAAQTLGLLGDARAVEPLMQALQDGDKCVRMAAAWALGRLGDARAASDLIQALEDEEWIVRSEAEQALVKIKADNIA